MLLEQTASSGMFLATTPLCMARRLMCAVLGPPEAIFNIIYAHFCTNKHDSALSRIANAHALHPRAHHLNINTPAGPRRWHTPSSRRGQSSTRSQHATSARAAAPPIGTTTRTTRRPSSYPRGSPRLHAREIQQHVKVPTQRPGTTRRCHVIAIATPATHLRRRGHEPSRQ